MIEARDLVKRYGSFEAVRGVTFTVPEGQVVGLLGPNGAGKTTIMRILTCYHFPSSGTARVNAHDVREEPLEVKKSVGYLPENAPLYADLKVLEYLRFIARIRGLPPAALRERVEWSIAQCGLAPVVYRDIGRLSKGYRQRVGLAQAILHDPRTLIMDEPTTGLDPGQIIEIRELIRELGREKTVVLSTHILQEVESICDEVIILNNGLVAAQGTAGELERSLARAVVLAVIVQARSAEEVDRELESFEQGRVTRRPSDLGSGRVLFELALDTGVSESAVFDWAVSRGLKIAGMTPKSSNLEEIFLKLTRPGQADA